MYPFHKVAEEFYKETDSNDKKRDTTKVAVQHKSYILRKEYEKALAEYNSGKRPNAFGLYKGETMSSSKKRIR